MSDHSLLECIEVTTDEHPTAAVIWMHGLGADGSDFVPIVRELNLTGCPGIRFVFPNADSMPITINGGYVMPAWYDILGMDLVRKEDASGLRKSQQQIEALIQREIDRGIRSEKIILAGFSQGCAMTLQTGLRFSHKLAGLMCLSGYLPLQSTVTAEHHAANKTTPIFMAHGRGDGVVTIDRAEKSREFLKELGYNIEWHEYLMQHSVCEEEIDDIGHWLQRLLA
jgi:phospholipase/carboxylesterase